MQPPSPPLPLSDAQTIFAFLVLKADYYSHHSLLTHHPRDTFLAAVYQEAAFNIGLGAQFLAASRAEIALAFRNNTGLDPDFKTAYDLIAQEITERRDLNPIAIEALQAFIRKHQENPDA